MLKLLENKKDLLLQNLDLNYQELVRNGVYGSINSQESLSSVLKGLSLEQIETLKKEFETINRDILYDSILHGPEHIERTLFWSFILSEKYLSTEEEKRISLDAAKYHDIGRRNDFEDQIHGRLSSEKVVSILNHPFYEREENRNLLCAVIELHSLSDKDEVRMIKKYKITNVDSFSRLWRILKDADALDRIRLSQGMSSNSALNPTYLRLPLSIHLIRASHELCTYYSNKELEEKKKIMV